MALEPVATTSGRTGLGGDETDGGIVIERHDDNAVSCRWTLPGFSQLSKQRTSTGWLAVGAGQDCRLLIYPGGEWPTLLERASSLRGKLCFAQILNLLDPGATVTPAPDCTCVTKAASFC